MPHTTDSLKIKIQRREPMSKGGIKKLRREGLLPASISSKGGEALSCIIRQDELMKSLSQNGRMAVFKLTLGRKVYNAMLKEVQYAPVSRECLHVTFQHIDLDEATRADVSVRPQGREDVLHKQLEFLQHLDALPVLGLPNDIPNSIEVDVSHMEAGDSLTVGDVQLPEGITTDMEPDRVIFTVSHPRAKQEPAEAADEAAAGGGEAGNQEAEQA